MRKVYKIMLWFLFSVLLVSTFIFLFFNFKVRNACYRIKENNKVPCGLIYISETDGINIYLAKVKQFVFKNDILYITLNFGYLDREFPIGKKDRDSFVVKNPEGVIETETITNSNGLINVKDGVDLYLNKHVKGKIAEVIINNNLGMEKLIVRVAEKKSEGGIDDDNADLRNELSEELNTYWARCKEVYPLIINNLNSKNYFNFALSHLDLAKVSYYRECMPNISDLSIY